MILIKEIKNSRFLKGTNQLLETNRVGDLSKQKDKKPLIDWCGLRAFIIGGGPSIAKMNLDPIKDQFVIGVNSAFRLGTWVDVCFFADNRFYGDNISYLEKWPNRIVSCAPKTLTHPKIEYLKRCQKHAICMERGKIGFPSKGANSGASAINLAIREGFTDIILLGFDLRVTQGTHNYHTHYRHRPNDKVYERFQAHFERIYKELNGVEVLNATPDSKLKFFPKVNLSNIL